MGEQTLPMTLENCFVSGQNVSKEVVHTQSHGLYSINSRYARMPPPPAIGRLTRHRNIEKVKCGLREGEEHGVGGARLGQLSPRKGCTFILNVVGSCGRP